MDSILFSGGVQRRVSSKNWHSEIIAGGYRAVIFDCDGTLVDSSETHFKSFQAAVRAQGYDLNRRWYAHRTGLDRQSLLSAFSADVSGPFDVHLATRQSIDAFISTATEVSPIVATVELVQTIGQSHPLAVGTNAEVEVATASLQAINLLGYFDLVVSVSDDLPAKPAPDIFTRAIQKLGFPAAKTLVIEDSAEGVRAAVAAGSDVFQVIHC
ncbi:hypothetical protein C1J03_22745 [Sulfitobacter sp. SK012]|uniref:HAD family hydrolase n=1 Tax=Sulfitobacter sp. SK012 TaxID=1389005 RepID=UPI000E0A295A|nr:HAD family phosphatase [Sulfitobacter sp. SK012]AXI48564.1 hypothetical protein C1J03_22745 [Sulfitobacter sp. SK012]